MPHPDSAFAAAKLEKEQALAKLRVLQSDALEGRLLDCEEVRLLELRDAARRLVQ
jgi:hypothetical protein